MGSRSDAGQAATAKQWIEFASAVRAEVIGQDHVIGPVLEWITQAELGLTDPNRPRGSFLFLGPTGVGKTQLAKVLGRGLGSRLARFDLSEFQTAESVDVFLGREADGRFGHEIDRNPGARVILFDEVEKAYPRLLDLLLQLLDEGRLTVASGRTFDVRNCYLLLTSNLGGSAAARMRHNSPAAIERIVVAQARQQLRPELFPRLDLVTVFHRLELPVQMQVCRYHLDRKLDHLRQQGVNVRVDPAVIPFLLGEGFSEIDGARPLERTIHQHINRPLMNAWAGGTSPHGTLQINATRSGLEFAAS